jgi:sulfatase maturation enzyme AslB (radical SAM superfamily)
MMPKRFKKIYIEISNVCNLQCSFCPEVVRGKGFMEPPLFKAAATAAADLTDVVCFHLMGEPLLHPQFESYLNLCGTLGLRVELTTNGILLDKKRAEALMNPALLQVNFSLQSFESNFPERDNSDYLQKIFDFTLRALQDRPDLYINYRLWNEGAAGADLSNDRMIKKIRQGLQTDFVVRPGTKSVHIKNRVYLHRDVRFEWPHPSQPIRSTTGFCHGLSSHIGILADGTVVPCCLDKEGVINLGNCGSTNLTKIVNGNRAQKIRKGFKERILVEDLCQKCTFITRFDKKAPRAGLEPATWRLTVARSTIELPRNFGASWKEKPGEDCNTNS